MWRTRPMILIMTGAAASLGVQQVALDLYAVMHDTDFAVLVLREGAVVRLLLQSLILMALAVIVWRVGREDA